MRILHLIDTLGRGGAETLLVNSIRAMPHHQHCLVYCTKPDDLCDRLEGIPTVRLDIAPRAATLPSIISALRRIQQRERSEILHSHSYWTMIAARRAAGHPTAVVNHYHFADYDTRATVPAVRAKILLDRWTRQRSHQLVAVSDYVSGILRRVHGPDANIDTVPNFAGEGFRNFQALPLAWRPGTPLCFVAVGSLNPEKNYSVLVEAFSKLADLPVSVDVWGDGPLRGELEDAARTVPGIAFRGSAAQIHEILPRYHAFVMPSVSEACPLAPIEAAMVGLPLFLSSIPALNEFGQGAAHFFIPDNAKTLADTIREVVTGQRPLVIQNADYRGLLKRYSKDRFINGLETVYSSAVR